MQKRRLRIIDQGLRKFAVCERCNAEFESTLLSQRYAKEEIEAKYDEHRCRRVDAGQP
jgi:hypothetical protein